MKRCAICGKTIPDDVGCYVMRQTLICIECYDRDPDIIWINKQEKPEPAADIDCYSQTVALSQGTC